MQSIDLHNGERIPQLGFGVFQVPPDDTAEVATLALQSGYRAIDTAAAYRNEAGVGAAVHASGLDREEIFITTKLWNRDHGREQARNAFEKSLGRLALDHVDLYLIHWPAPGQDRYVETWETLVELHGEGRVRSIGVSNFLAEHLDRIIDATGVVPAVNQVELHPAFQQQTLRRHHEELGIRTEAWSPLAQGAVLDEPLITALAREHRKSPAQIVLRWHLQLGNIVIPKSVTPARIAENFDIFNFELSEDEMQSFETLETGERTGPDPATFTTP